MNLICSTSLSVPFFQCPYINCLPHEIHPFISRNARSKNKMAEIAVLFRDTSKLYYKPFMICFHDSTAIKKKKTKKNFNNLFLVIFLFFFFFFLFCLQFFESQCLQFTRPTRSNRQVSAIYFVY